MKFISNKQIAHLFRDVAAAYTVKGEQFFKIRAYENAADSAEHATSELKDLWEEGQLDSVPGLGTNIRQYLDELFKTGKVKHFEQTLKDLPDGMFKLLDIGGVGPKTAYKLATELKIKDLGDLERAIETNKIRDLEGFGKKSEDELKASLLEFKGRPNRYLLPIAFRAAEQLIDYLKKNKNCAQAQPLGSLRRMVATVGDIDIAVASKNPKAIIDSFKKYPQNTRILNAGTISASAILKNGIQADLKIQPLESYGALLQHFTGSKNHNIALRELSLKKGMSLSEYGIKEKNKILKFKTEEEFYKHLGLEWIPPELRENKGEIEAAQKNLLPTLVQNKDIKGDIHLHSDFAIEPSHDLGKNSFEEIIRKAKELGYAYVGLSDHSPGFSTHTKEQIVDIIKRRSHKIEQQKAANRGIGILNLLEIDILNTGELSVPEEGLKLLNGAIAGIHSSHKQDKKTITRRLLNACENPYVKVISHPTGRLLMQRDSYEADWPQIFKACEKTGTLLEINSWPSRLDLPDTLIHEALKYKVKFIINTDAHEISEMDNMPFGVSVARRGWATKKDIVNTLPWLEFRKLFM